MARAQEVEIADDHAEQIVEVMRHAAREVADRLHLSRLRQLLLGDTLLGDVLDDADHLRRLSLGIAKYSGALMDPANGPVGPDDTVIDSICLTVLDCQPTGFGHRRQVIRMDHPEKS